MTLLSAALGTTNLLIDGAEQFVETEGSAGISAALKAEGYAAGEAKALAEENPAVALAAFAAAAILVPFVAPELLIASAAELAASPLMAGVASAIELSAEAGGLSSSAAELLGANCINVASPLIINLTAEQTTEGALENLFTAATSLVNSSGGSLTSLPADNGSYPSVDASEVGSNNASLMVPGSGSSVTNGVLLSLPSSSGGGLLTISAGQGQAITLDNGLWSNVDVGQDSSGNVVANVANSDGTSQTIQFNSDGSVLATTYSGANGTGTVLETDNISAAGVQNIQISNGATVNISESSSSADTINLGTDSSVVIDGHEGFAGTINGFAVGDSITITNAGYTTFPFQGFDSSEKPVLYIEMFSANSPTVEFADNGAGLYSKYTYGTNYEYVPYPSIDAVITLEPVNCFLAGTHILTPVAEVEVNKLAIGDVVSIYGGGQDRIKFIGRRSYGAPFINNNPNVQPVCVAANAIEDGIPVRDLRVSPGHAILIDGALIHASQLVNGKTITQDMGTERIDYFHVELASGHDILIAEGCAAESFRNEQGFRNRFQNAAEFYALYPDDDDADAAQFSCYPHLESGFHLHAILQRLAKRAGIIEQPHKETGPLRGYLETSGTDGKVVGWAQDEDAPETPVCLDVVVDGKRVVRVLANYYRADLRAAGLGSGCHGFEAQLPANVAGRVEVRRSIDEAELVLTHSAATRLRWHKARRFR